MIIFQATKIFLVVVFLLLLPSIFCLIFILDVTLSLLKRRTKLYESYNSFYQVKNDFQMRNLFKKFLQLECNKTSEIPFYLVNSYLYLNEGMVFEYFKKTKKLSRCFQFDSDVNKIRIDYFYNFKTRKSEFLTLVDHIDPEVYKYTNHRLKE